MPLSATSCEALSWKEAHRMYFFNLQAKCRLDLVWMQLCWMANVLTLDLSRWGPFHMQKSPWTQSFLSGKPCSFARRGRMALIITWRLQSKGTASSHRFDLCVYLIRAFPKWAGFQKWHFVRWVGGIYCQREASDSSITDFLRAIT